MTHLATRLRLSGASAAAAALLLGCTAPGAETGGTLGAIGALIETARADAPEPLRPVGDFPGIDPALIAGVTNPLMGLYLPESEALGTLGMPSRAGTVTTWMSADSGSVSVLDPGVVIATRGLPTDLHASDAAAVARAVIGRAPASYERLYRVLDTTHAPQDIIVTCQLSREQAEALSINRQTRRTVRMVERCSGGPDGASIENVYWVDPEAPVIWQSQQWLGPEMGAAFLQRLVL